MEPRLRFGWWAALACVAAAPVLAAGELPVGLQAAPSAVVTAGRIVLAVWGVALLALARRRPRLAVGTFFLLAGAAIGFGPLAPVAYPLALLAALAVLAAGLAVHAAAPRVAMAAALAWPLPALLAASVLLGGGMTMNRVALPALAVVGAVLGALIPEVSVGFLGAALGTALVAVAWPGELAFWPLAALLAAGVAWQAVLPRLLRPPLLERRPATSRERVRAALTAARAGALAVVAALVAVVIAAPVAAPAGGDHAARAGRLRAATGGRPALLLSPAGSFYLSGVAHPVALVAEPSSLAARLGVLVRGRSCARELGRLRAVKDERELAALRRAAEITAAAQRAVAPLVRPGANERDLEAAVLAAYAAGGATGVAFKSVVGAGANAVLPHYQENDAELRAGLVVVDIGCSVDSYAADITRTFPVAGEWSEAERRLLDAVLAAKEEARAALKPGASLRALNRRAHESIDRAGFGKYFIHGLSHHVGIEVHDAHVDTLAAGMVVTIEPGIYIPAGSAVDRAYWDLGIRVEDTYLVTPQGGVALAELPEVLPAGAAATAGS